MGLETVISASCALLTSLFLSPLRTCVRLLGDQRGRCPVWKPHGALTITYFLNNYFLLNVGWTMGLEPTTTGITIQGSTN
jgi:hypothetical protein